MSKSGHARIVRLADLDPPAPSGRWGPWVFVASNLTLLHEVEGYEIDLEEIDSAAEVLDWVFQIQAKRWCDPATLAGLVEAFAEVLDPQANYCSFGKAKRASGSTLAKRHRARLAGKDGA